MTTADETPPWAAPPAALPSASQAAYAIIALSAWEAARRRGHRTPARRGNSMAHTPLRDADADAGGDGPHAVSAEDRTGAGAGSGSGGWHRSPVHPAGTQTLREVSAIVPAHAVTAIVGAAICHAAHVRAHSANRPLAS